MGKGLGAKVSVVKHTLCGFRYIKKVWYLQRAPSKMQSASSVSFYTG